MSLSRRTFVAAGALGIPLMLLPTSFVLGVGKSSPRMKLEEFVKDPARLKSLRAGVANMKAMKPSAPGSWFYQGAIHAVSTEQIKKALAQDPDIEKVDQLKFWNQCPHYGQSSADFLLWHRAYIFYFEKYLRLAADDPSLSLPYWNYTDKAQRGFPREFAGPVGAEGEQNSLFDRHREQAFMAGMYELSDRAVDDRALRIETDFFGETEVRGLAGGVADSDGGTKGLIERQPHDSLHFAIGGALTGTMSTEVDGEAVEEDRNLWGWMSDVSTAAFDPVFWVHHANVDRLWAEWDCISNPPRSWGKVPPDTWLEAQPWFFNDPDEGVKNHKRLYYLDRRNLAFTYDTDNASCKPLSATVPMPSTVIVHGGVKALSLPHGIKSFSLKSVLGGASQSQVVTPDVPSILSGKVLPIGAGEGATLKSNVFAVAPTLARRLLLEITGIKVNGIPSVGYDVYVNVPAGETLSRDSQNYAGVIALFGINHGHAGHDSGATQRFDIAQMLLADVITGSDITLTIEPYDLLQPKNDQKRLRREVGLSYTGFRVLLLEGSGAEIM